MAALLLEGTTENIDAGGGLDLAMHGEGRPEKRQKQNQAWLCPPHEQTIAAVMIALQVESVGLIPLDFPLRKLDSRQVDSIQHFRHDLVGTDTCVASVRLAEDAVS